VAVSWGAVRLVKVNLRALRLVPEPEVLEWCSLLVEWFLVVR